MSGGTGDGDSSAWAPWLEDRGQIQLPGPHRPDSKKTKGMLPADLFSADTSSARAVARSHRQRARTAGRARCSSGTYTPPCLSAFGVPPRCSRQQELPGDCRRREEQRSRVLAGKPVEDRQRQDIEDSG
jgi:hypothetical protein